MTFREYRHDITYTYDNIHQRKEKKKKNEKHNKSKYKS